MVCRNRATRPREVAVEGRKRKVWLNNSFRIPNETIRVELR